MPFYNFSHNLRPKCRRQVDFLKVHMSSHILVPMLHSFSHPSKRQMTPNFHVRRRWTNIWSQVSIKTPNLYFATVCADMIHVRTVFRSSSSCILPLLSTNQSWTYVIQFCACCQPPLWLTCNASGQQQILRRSRGMVEGPLGPKFEFLQVIRFYPVCGKCVHAFTGRETICTGKRRLHVSRELEVQGACESLLHTCLCNLNSCSVQWNCCHYRRSLRNSSTAQWWA